MGDPTQVNQAGGISDEQTIMTNDQANLAAIPTDFEIYDPRPNRRRRSEEDNFTYAGLWSHYFYSSLII